MRPSVVWVVTLLCAGCTSERQSPPPGEPLPLDSFCATLATSWCDARMRCACPSDTACVDNHVQQCENALVTEALTTAVDEGRVVYDEAAARRLADRLEEPTCEHDFGFGYVETLTLGGVFTGTLSAGQDCMDDVGRRVSECARGVCDVDVCIEFVGAGASCDNHHICTNLDAPFSAGGPRPSLTCERPFGADSGTCLVPEPIGSGCEDGDECQTGFCDETSTCAARTDGSPCGSPIECASGHCERGRCTGGAGYGEACASGDECRSFSCVDGTCAASTCFVSWGGLPIGF